MEFVPAKSRGLLTNLMNIYWSIGNIFTVLLAWYLKEQWRWIFVVCSVPAWISFGMHLFMYESPRFLLIHDRVDEANAVVNGIARWNKSLIGNVHLIDKSSHQEDTHSKFPIFTQFRMLFSSELLRTTLMLWVMWFGYAYANWGFKYAHITATYNNLASFYPLCLNESCLENYTSTCSFKRYLTCLVVLLPWHW